MAFERSGERLYIGLSRARGHSLCGDLGFIAIRVAGTSLGG